MLYFDIRPCLKRLTAEEKGILFEAILDYGEFGLLPEIEGALGVAWDFIQPRLDRDRERYEEISLKRTAAINSRWEKSKAIHENTFEYNEVEAIPTSPSTSNSTSLSTTTTTATATGDGRPHRPLTTEQSAENLKRSQIQKLLSWNG